jgi:putative NADH-flavin reductase
MKVLVFGASDATGRAVVTQALEAGHEVTAVAPAGAVVAPAHERLEIVEGDVTDQPLVDKAVLGQDAVLSVVGVSGRRPATLYSEAAANIVEALEKADPRRVLCLSSNRVEADGPGLTPGGRLYRKLIVHRRYRNPLNDMSRMENELERSDLDWTVVRPATLTDGPATGAYRTAIGGRHVPHGRTLSTGDLGHYLANHLDDPATYRTIVELAH